ncbi:MAG: serine/threonine-protein kinase, partial [Myxococcota bacterium]
MGETTTHHGPRSEVRIGRYVVEAKLGEGGMAETWLCRLTGAKGFSRRVVIKTLKPECVHPEYQTMFADEARVGARLDHPNIARVLEFGESRGVPFLVQEYVEGPSVYQILHQQRVRRAFDLRLGCRIVHDVAVGLDYAHHAQDEDGRPMHVVHRDVSPSNVLVSHDGRVKLIDFGVALFENRETRTQAGVLKGKFRYMAPEILLRDDVSHQSDLYSLGIILYGLCVGEPAWAGSDEIADRLAGKVQRPRARRPDLSPELDRIVMTCLELDPKKRYPSGAALAADLAHWLTANGGPVADAYVAEEIRQLFPDGAADWRVSYDRTALTSLTIRHARPAVPWKWIAAGSTAVLAVSFAGVLGATGAVWLLVTRTAPAPAQAVVAPIEAPPTAALAPESDPRAAAAMLLDSAEVALANHDAAEASSRLRAASGLALTDPALLARRERLLTRVQVDAGVETTRRLIAVDPAAALERAMELDGRYPGEPAVSALLVDAREGVTRARA